MERPWVGAGMDLLMSLATLETALVSVERIAECCRAEDEFEDSTGTTLASSLAFGIMLNVC